VKLIHRAWFENEKYEKREEGGGRSTSMVSLYF
jgi:hypothetical protein